MTPLTKFNRATLERRIIGEGRYGEEWPPSDLTKENLPVEICQEGFDGVGNYLVRLWQLECGWRAWAMGLAYYLGLAQNLIVLAIYDPPLDELVNHSRKVKR